MIIPILSTKLHKPKPASNVVTRSQLFDVLDRGIDGKCIVVSAPAGFGKTTVITSWLETVEHAVAWLSLEESDNELSRFLRYLIAALQSIEPHIGQQILPALQSEQDLPIENVMTILLNDLTNIEQKAILVLDDYHSIDTLEIDKALTFLVDHLPNNMTLVITTREDPQLPLAKYRVRAELTELRASDLRFTKAEMHTFLNQMMGLDLTENSITALENRTEGWIASLQMVAISLQRQADKTQFIETFTGSHRYILDYLLEEVLHQQSEETRTFLLQTSILRHLNADLCDAVTQTHDSQSVLELLERRNLFIVPLDDERTWYRYHYLFTDLLRQRLLRDSAGFSTEDVNELHTRASIWYEANGLELEAFQHAIAIHDIERAERLIESQGTPLYLRGIVKPIYHWLESLPNHMLDSHPSLWVAYASTLLLTGQHTAVEQKLSQAENALKNAKQDDSTQDVMGRIASMRSTLAVIDNDVETIVSQSRYALAHLNPNNLPVRIATQWTLGYAYQLQGDHQLARHAYEEILLLSDPIENSFYAIVATISLGQLQELDNQLHQASESYQNAIKLSGNPPHPIASQALLGLARICYQWNELESAQAHAQQCHELLQQMENTDTTASYKVLIAALHLAQGDFTSASDALYEAEAFVRQNNFMFRMPDIVEAQVRVLIHQQNLTTALQLTETYDLPVSQARIYLAQQNPSRALQILAPFIQKAQENGLQYELLKGLVLQALVYNALSQQDVALEVLAESLALAKSGGFIRIFIDEGMPMQALLSQALDQQIFPIYAQKLLKAFESNSASQPRIDPLSERELEVLRLVAEGLSNREISKRLFVALDTVKGHNRNIYQKLQVSRRTEAVARARELGLI